MDACRMAGTLDVDAVSIGNLIVGVDEQCHQLCVLFFNTVAGMSRVKVLTKWSPSLTLLVPMTLLIPLYEGAISLATS